MTHQTQVRVPCLIEGVAQKLRQLLEEPNGGKSQPLSSQSSLIQSSTAVRRSLSLGQGQWERLLNHVTCVLDGETSGAPPSQNAMASMTSSWGGGVVTSSGKLADSDVHLMGLSDFRMVRYTQVLACRG